MAGGIAWFSAASIIMPLALTPQVAAAGLAIPVILAARCMVVGCEIEAPCPCHQPA